MVTIYVTTKERGSGNTSVCAGIGKLVLSKGKKPGYLKPTLSAGNVDDGEFMKNVLSLEEPVDVICPVVSGNSAAALKENLGKISSGKDVIIIEGPPEHYQSSSDIVKELNAKLVIVEPYAEDLSQAIVGYKGFGQVLLGVIINKVPESRMDRVKGEEVEQLAKVGVKCLGVIPEDRALAAITIGEIAACIDGEMLRGEEKSGELVESLMLGAMTVDSGPEYFGRKENKAAIIRSGRPDMQLAAISTSTKCLVLTGETSLKPAVLIKAEEKDIPVIATRESSNQVMENIEAALAGSKLNQESKLDRFGKLMKQNLNLELMTKELGLG